MRSCCVLAAILVVGCAKAGAPDVQGNQQVDGGTVGGNVDGGHSFPHPDATPGVDAAVPVDAAPIPDAAPGLQQVTLSQTTSSTIRAVNSIACGPSASSGHVGTDANTYYRVFDLSAAGGTGVVGDLTVNTVSFQVEDCESITNDGTTLSVRIGTYSGTVGSTLDPTKISILASNNAVDVPEIDEGSNSTPGGTVNAPVAAVVPANSKMVIEVDAPDGLDEYEFYIGTNRGGESGTSYFSAPDCDPPGATPSDMGTIAGHETDFLLTVTGTYQP